MLKEIHVVINDVGPWSDHVSRRDTTSILDSIAIVIAPDFFEFRKLRMELFWSRTNTLNLVVMNNKLDELLKTSTSSST